MESQIPSLELTLCSNNYVDQAWHLVSVLLSIGRPASVAELAVKCSLLSVSPELVEFLSEIPNSPILLSRNGFVLLSMVAFSAFGEFFANSMPKLQIEGSGVKMLCGNGVRTYFRKRKRFGNEEMALTKKRAVLDLINGKEEVRTSLYSSERMFDSSFEVADSQMTDIGRLSNTLPSGMSIKAALWEYLSNILYVHPLMLDTSAAFLQYQTQCDKESGIKHNTSLACDMHDGSVMEEHSVPEKCQIGDVTSSVLPDVDKEGYTAPLLETLAEISAMLDDRKLDLHLTDGLDAGTLSLAQPDQQAKSALGEAEMNDSKDPRNNRIPERLEELAEKLLIDHVVPEEGLFNISLGSLGRDLSPRHKSSQANRESFNCGFPALMDNPAINGGSESLVYVDSQSMQKCAQYSATTKIVPENDQTGKQQVVSNSVQHSQIDIVNKKRRNQRDQDRFSIKHKSKQTVGSNVLIEERRDNVRKFPKDQQSSKAFPEFESYVVEEEEGSGGYGIVYRARRKSDGIRFAIKCPRVNAHKHHVKNELKMLERFGGKNFVIKYEGSFKNGGSDCFVLEHVEHDRPEVLKREINIFQLQWYGYCMFRALASLHKQGVFHRDVKPGNFLFSCKTSKGYLIDFNLAKDLHQKHESNDKSQTSCLASSQHVPGSQSKSVSPNKRRKILGGKSIDASKASLPTGSNIESKSLKKKTVDKLKTYEGLGGRNSITSQGADASGLTSTKDVTPSGERLREPLPSQGRKELINFAQEAMQSPTLVAASTPASNRKRIAASPGIVDKKLIYLTPMPLHSSGFAISGAGSLKNRGEAKLQKEGLCVGTKGFRAPEVLLRSLHQGPKIDVWSAGVTLLYLITGKLPFTGDPEQNMKDIAKIRGNEDLWEVAKLHNRESSFPMDLLDVRYLPAVKIQEWCAANTKRLDFLEVIPRSLFDLIEKCLTVNPRLRISAEEALRHEFFAPCHEALQKQRSMRRAPNHDSGSNSLPLIHHSSTTFQAVKASTPVKKFDNSSMAV